MRTVCRLMLLGVLLGMLLPQSASAAGLRAQRTWAGNQIHLYDAQSAGFTGRGVTVAILDGWVDTHHKDFEGRAVSAADCTSGTCTSTVGRDSCGQNHGTHVAGTIASSSYGVAPKATLLAVRVLAADDHGDCAGSPSNVAAGIEWAVDHGAEVINLSLGPDVPGATSTSAIPAAVHAAAARGVVVVFSAGNRNLPVAQAYGQDALVVAATGPSGSLASYSQHGEGVSVAAPGGQPTSTDQCSQARCITSLYPSNQYAVAAGTSMAAPHVSGLAALLFQQRPGRSRADVEQRIEGTAHALSGGGAGRIDVAAALGVHRAAASPRATSTRSSPPKPRATVAPRRPAVHAAGTPSPLTVKKTAPPTVAPTTGAPSPTPSPVSITTLAGPGSDDDEVPLGLAGLAGALIGLAGAAVLLFGADRD